MNDDLPLCTAPHCGSVVRRGYSRCSRCLLTEIENKTHGRPSLACSMVCSWLNQEFGTDDDGGGMAA